MFCLVLCIHVHIQSTLAGNLQFEKIREAETAYNKALDDGLTPEALEELSKSTASPFILHLDSLGSGGLHPTSRVTSKLRDWLRYVVACSECPAASPAANPAD